MLKPDAPIQNAFLLAKGQVQGYRLSLVREAIGSRVPVILSATHEREMVIVYIPYLTPDVRIFYLGRFAPVINAMHR